MFLSRFFLRWEHQHLLTSQHYESGGLNDRRNRDRSDRSNRVEETDALASGCGMGGWDGLILQETPKCRIKKSI